MTINRKFFFDQVRSHLFTGKLTAPQVSGLSFILDEWESNHKNKDDRWLAYALGTAFHETGFTMQPVVETGSNAYKIKMYSPNSSDPKRAALAKKNGQLTDKDALDFCGKGYVQLTWRNNYARMSGELGLDLVAHPDMVLNASVAARIMFQGMEEGAFTGVKFATYFNATKEDWVNARRIINGLDCADKIAVYAKGFYAAISYTTG